MSLKNLPLDAAKLGAALCISVAVKTDTMTGVIKTDTDGVTLYVVSVAVAPEGSKAALIEVTVAGEPKGLIVGTHVALKGLEAFFWEVNGKSGIVFRADAVIPAMAPLAPQVPTVPPAVSKAAAK